MKRVLLPAVIALAGTAWGGEDVLRNGGFEEAAADLPAGWGPVWPGFLPEKPRFSLRADAPRGGKACAGITVAAGGGYTSLTQIIAKPPAGARSARLSGWVRAEKGAAASLMVLFFDPDDPSVEKLHETPRPRAEAGWVPVEVEAPVPAGAKRWMVRCGIAGAGTASFDDVSLTWSAEALEGDEAVLAVARGRYFVAAPGGRECSIDVSVPFPIGGQTPLAIRVESDPPGAVVRLELRKSRENRPLRVTVKAPAKGKVRLRPETVVLLRDRPLADGAGLPLVRPPDIPDEAKLHLKGAPGVDAGDRRVKDIAARLGREDYKALLGDLMDSLKKDLKYAGGGHQGARRCLESGQAVCTGYANVAAAVLIAAGVPARILACTGVDGKLQEHYIVEAWAGRSAGWLRIETTMAAFPWGDTRNIVLRVIYPDARRSPVAVPLFFELKGTAEGGFDMDPADGCWQSAETLGRPRMDRKEVEVIEASARKAFEAATGQASAGSRIRLLPDAAAIPGLGERGRRCIESAEAAMK